MKSIVKLFILLSIIFCSSCNYLDIVPDNVPTIQHAFSNRTEAERYLYTCYSYRPQIGDVANDPAMNGGDETWQYYPVGGIFPTWPSSYIARGYQNANDPLLGFWGGTRDAKQLWQGIRDCNIFLEEIGTVGDLSDYEKKRWSAEVKFLKAYYHYYLFKCYGPIPIVDVNLPVSAGIEEVLIHREPVDKVVKYINDLMMEAFKDLPNPNEIIESSEAGRVDKLAALSMRAELLLFAASPLFNGNSDYSGMIDNRGVKLFNDAYDANKWKTAADACKEAIDLCHANNKALYDLIDPLTVNSNPVFQLQTTYRQAICDRWNKELIWGSTNNDCNGLSQTSHARILRLSPDKLNEINSQWAPTLKIVEKYYSANGVPINEDKDWQTELYPNRYKIRNKPSSADEIYYVKEGQKTVYLHYQREPRFYASIGFDRGIYYGSGYFKFPDDVKHCEFLNLEYSGFQGGSQYSITGYAAKKMHSFRMGVTANNSPIVEYYPFPIMRLANLYLMYAEALNEHSGPSDEVYTYIDKVRARAGLGGVKSSWLQYSNKPNKPDTKDGLREIIHQERTIELAFEGKRFWDIRRWKKIGELNTQPQGWNVIGETPEDFYKVVSIAQMPVKFTVKDYLWPIKNGDIIVNKNLIQNYGW